MATRLASLISAGHHDAGVTPDRPTAITSAPTVPFALTATTLSGVPVAVFALNAGTGAGDWSLTLATGLTGLLGITPSGTTCRLGTTALFGNSNVGSHNCSVRYVGEGADLTFPFTAVVSGTVSGTLIARDSVFNAVLGTAQAVPVLANADAGGATIAGVTVITQPLFGTAAAQADKTVRYTPAAGFVGEDVFQYQYTDSNSRLSNIATCYIRVSTIDFTTLGYIGLEPTHAFDTGRSIVVPTIGTPATVDVNNGLVSQDAAADNETLDLRDKTLNNHIAGTGQIQLIRVRNHRTGRIITGARLVGNDWDENLTWGMAYIGAGRNPSSGLGSPQPKSSGADWPDTGYVSIPNRLDSEGHSRVGWADNALVAFAISGQANQYEVIFENIYAENQTDFLSPEWGFALDSGRPANTIKTTARTTVIGFFVTDHKDDFFEADGGLSVKAVDGVCLGTKTLLSHTKASSADPGSASTVVMDRVLMRCQQQPYDYQASPGGSNNGVGPKYRGPWPDRRATAKTNPWSLPTGWDAGPGYNYGYYPPQVFKWQDASVRHLTMTNCVMFVDSVRGDAGTDSSADFPTVGCTYSNNLLIWGGAVGTSYPGTLPASGVTVVRYDDIWPGHSPLTYADMWDQLISAWLALRGGRIDDNDVVDWPALHNLALSPPPPPPPPPPTPPTALTSTTPPKILRSAAVGTAIATISQTGGVTPLYNGNWSIPSGFDRARLRTPVGGQTAVLEVGPALVSGDEGTRHSNIQVTGGELGTTVLPITVTFDIVTSPPPPPATGFVHVIPSTDIRGFDTGMTVRNPPAKVMKDPTTHNFRAWVSTDPEDSGRYNITPPSSNSTYDFHNTTLPHYEIDNSNAKVAVYLDTNGTFHNISILGVKLIAGGTGKKGEYHKGQVAWCEVKGGLAVASNPFGTHTCYNQDFPWDMDAFNIVDIGKLGPVYIEGAQVYGVTDCLNPVNLTGTRGDQTKACWIRSSYIDDLLDDNESDNGGTAHFWQDCYYAGHTLFSCTSGGAAFHWMEDCVLWQARLPYSTDNGGNPPNKDTKFDGPEHGAAVVSGNGWGFTCGKLFKQDAATALTVHWKNVILRWESMANSGSGTMHWPAGTYENCTLVWGGAAKFPWALPDGWTYYGVGGDPGFDWATGLALWLDARTEWLTGHGYTNAAEPDGLTVATSIPFTNIWPTQAVTKPVTTAFSVSVVGGGANHVDANVISHTTEGTYPVSTVTVTTNPSHGACAVQADNTIRYTPTASYTGATDSFAYKVTDNQGNASNVSTVSVALSYGTDWLTAMVGSMGYDKNNTSKSGWNGTMLNGRRATTTVGLFPGDLRVAKDNLRTFTIKPITDATKAGDIPQYSTPMCFDDQATGFVNGSGWKGGWMDDYDAGGMDAYWAGTSANPGFFKRIVKAGTTKCIFRIGWEAQGPSFPWNLACDVNYNASTDAQWAANFEQWKSVWRKIATYAKNESADFMTDFCIFDEPSVDGKAAKTTFYYPHPDEFYPGEGSAANSACVDIISSDNYCAPEMNGHNTRAEVGAFFTSKKRAGRNADGSAMSGNVNPRGPHAWFLYARSKGKLYNNPEWGVRAASGDCDWWIYWMWKYYVNQWKDYTVSNWYFNGGDGKIFNDPGQSSVFPKSYNRFRATFGATATVYNDAADWDGN